jgi:hypothetical protein
MAAPIDIKINYSGNSLKNMNVSVDASLRKLRTHYIDIFYVHWWDYTASIEEMMNGLHNLVVAGKVLYLVRAHASYLLPQVMMVVCAGYLRRPGVGSLRCQSVRPRPRKDTLCDLSRCLECHVSFI